MDDSNAGTSLTEQKWKHFGTQEAVEKSRRRDPIYIHELKGTCL